MPTKRHKANNNAEDDQKSLNKPLMDGYYDNWTWSKRHRSQEVVFTDTKMRKGKTLLNNSDCTSN